MSILSNKKNLTRECYKKSVRLLLENSHKYGVMASAVTDEAKRKMYVNVFGRDAVCRVKIAPDNAYDVGVVPRDDVGVAGVAFVEID